MTAVPIDLAAERLVRRVAADLLAVRPGECLVCYVARMINEFGCDCKLRFAKRFRDSEAPRATALERRLGQVGGFCDCGIFLNGWVLHPRFRQRVQEVDPFGIIFEKVSEEAVELQPCATVRRGSIRPCANWVRRSRGWF